MGRRDDQHRHYTVVALRTLARRAHTMVQEARERQKAILVIIRGWLDLPN